MENVPTTPTALLNRGVAAYHAGNRDEALQNLAQALLIDPESELGWLWFAAVTDDPAEKRYALDRAVSINPDSIGGALKKIGGLKAGMGYCGTPTINELRTETKFIQVSAASVRESHPHDIAITQEAPNYSSEVSSKDGI